MENINNHKYASYNLTDISGFKHFFKTGLIEDEYTNLFSYNCSVVKYNKKSIADNYDLIKKYGLLRSVILSTNNHSTIIGFAPPKSIPQTNFMNNYPIIANNEHIVVEEFVEGIMVNMFYDFCNECWEIATKNVVGGENKCSSTKNVRQLFNDIFVANDEIKLNPDWCYCFVLQHPDIHQMVSQVKTPALYLTDVFCIVQMPNGENAVVEQIPRSLFIQTINTEVIKFPTRYNLATYAEIVDKFASPYTPYNIMGVVIRNNETGERMKIRNPNYETAKHMKTEENKFFFKYLSLRQANIEIVNKEAEKLVIMFINDLYQNYVSCFIKKEKPLIEYPEQYKTHMYKLHNHYKRDLVPIGRKITKDTVSIYVGHMMPLHLFKSLTKK